MICILYVYMYIYIYIHIRGHMGTRDSTRIIHPNYGLEDNILKFMLKTLAADIFRNHCESTTEMKYTQLSRPKSWDQILAWDQ